jgi:hypothetical protein
VFSLHNTKGTCALATLQTLLHISTRKDRILRSTKMEEEVSYCMIITQNLKETVLVYAK